MMATARPTRIGMIVPSSNTCLEPMSYRLLGDREDVTIHSTRIPVTRIALDSGSDQQFDVKGMRNAAEMLATADVDVIAWNGTSGSWLGPEHDREIVAEITAATDIPATTSTLAYLDAFEASGIKTIGLVTPYTADVNLQVIERYKEAGVQVTGHHALGLIDNESFARVAPSDLVGPSLELAAQSPDALVYLCTNLYAAPIVADIENQAHIPALDSVAVTLWRCLQIAGAPLLSPRWGKLLT
ncbi:aspartate/glutamate racemase family protein [Arthrobacter sp. GN70]|uniref:Asp/Glu racemase n=2 Tax=Arthrobacter TaxID=1663 RepID=A0A4R5KEF1_9MICC|nr:aspartate/glutamate racemase family protein [Arthrobacter sp. GN70]TDF93701.1 Asp/Glu racemase [Arthrobacter terricola]